MRTSLWVGIVVASSLLAGCQTARDRRISTHQATWQTLSAHDQNRLRQGYVGRGDTEAMVTIALGSPDRVHAINGPDGQRLTVWLYDHWNFANEAFLSDSTPAAWTTSQEESVIFQDGVFIDRAMIGIESTTKLMTILTQHAAIKMTGRLDRQVKLTSAQREQAHAIFAQAAEALYAIRPAERAEKAQALRVRLRADIRALLTAGQQEKYDAALQAPGGGSPHAPAPGR